MNLAGTMFGAAAQIGTVQSFYNYYRNAVWDPSKKSILPAPGLDDDCGVGFVRRGLLCCPIGQNTKSMMCQPRGIPPVTSGPQRQDRGIKWHRDRDRKFSPHRPTPDGGKDTELSADIMGGTNFSSILIGGALIFGGVWVYKKYLRKGLKLPPAVGGGK